MDNTREGNWIIDKNGNLKQLNLSPVENKKPMRLIDANRFMKEMDKLEHAAKETADSFVNLSGNRSIEFNRLKDYIDNAPTVNTQWVLLKEGLPKDDTPCLISTRDDEDRIVVNEDVYFRDSKTKTWVSKNWGDECDDKCVIAWMFLPTIRYREGAMP